MDMAQQLGSPASPVINDGRASPGFASRIPGWSAPPTPDKPRDASLKATRFGFYDGAVMPMPTPTNENIRKLVQDYYDQYIFITVKPRPPLPTKQNYIENWDVSGVTIMRGLFSGLALFDKDISRWDVSNVTDMAFMFDGCHRYYYYNKTHTLSHSDNFGDIGTTWNVSNVTNMSGMFNGCSHFNGNVGGWKVDKVTDMSAMFNGCVSFNQDITDWKVSRVTNMFGMFRECKNFNFGNYKYGPIVWDVSPIVWDVSNVTNMSYMFAGCETFDQDISHWNVSNVTDMSHMFDGCTLFEFDSPFGDIDDKPIIVRWKVSNVTNMDSMFYNCHSLDVDISNWDVSNVTDMSEMFHGCRNFYGDISKWDVKQVRIENENPDIIDNIFFDCNIPCIRKPPRFRTTDPTTILLLDKFYDDQTNTEICGSADDDVCSVTHIKFNDLRKHKRLVVLDNLYCFSFYAFSLPSNTNDNILVKNPFTRRAWEKDDLSKIDFIRKHKEYLNCEYEVIENADDAAKSGGRRPRKTHRKAVFTSRKTKSKLKSYVRLTRKRRPWSKSPTRKSRVKLTKTNT
jgi:surface protein